jgi:hypothetical protein
MVFVHPFRNLGRDASPEDSHHRERRLLGGILADELCGIR